MRPKRKSRTPNDDDYQGGAAERGSYPSGERIIPVRAELKIAEGNGTALYMMVAETTAEESRNAANKKSSGSSRSGGAKEYTREISTTACTLSITEFYDLVKHDPNFTKVLCG